MPLGGDGFVQLPPLTGLEHQPCWIKYINYYSSNKRAALWEKIKLNELENR